MTDKHSPVCKVMMILLLVGGVNWGLVGLGGFLGTELNVVKLLLGTWPVVEWIVYLLVGVSAVAVGAAVCKGGCCGEMCKK